MKDGKIKYSCGNEDEHGMVGNPVNATDVTSEWRYFLKGWNGQLYVYENKIEITRKGFQAFFAQGLKGAKTIPISEIKSVQLKLSGVMRGYIQFGIGGGAEDKGGIDRATYDENTVTFHSFNKKEAQDINKKAQEIKNYIETLILNKTNLQYANISPISNADELKKYKELLDMGAITQAEFELKKKQILGF